MVWKHPNKIKIFIESSCKVCKCTRNNILKEKKLKCALTQTKDTKNTRGCAISTSHSLSPTCPETGSLFATDPVALESQLRARNVPSRFEWRNCVT